MKNWLKKNLTAHDRLRGERIHRVLGDRIFDWELWHLSRHSTSGGIAVGLFVAFTPTIPFQMLLSALGAIWLQVNLPLALLASWTANPLTAVWIYLLAHRIGKAVIGNTLGFLVVSDLEEVAAIWRLFSHGVSLSTGGVLLGAVAAIMGYTGTQVLWVLLIGSGPAHGEKVSGTDN